MDFTGILSFVEHIKSNNEAAIEQIKKQLPEMDAESRKVINQGIGKLEKTMKEIRFPTLSELSSGNFNENTTEIIHKLEQISLEFQKLQERCLL